VLKSFLEGIIRDAVTWTEHARRMIVTAMDVVYALKRARPCAASGAKLNAAHYLETAKRREKR
jgi:hypothetical protein